MSRRWWLEWELRGGEGLRTTGGREGGPEEQRRADGRHLSSQGACVRLEDVGARRRPAACRGLGAQAGGVHRGGREPPPRGGARARGRPSTGGRAGGASVPGTKGVRPLTGTLPAIHLPLVKLPFYGPTLSPIIDKNLLWMFGIIRGKNVFLFFIMFFNINVFLLRAAGKAGGAQGGGEGRLPLAHRVLPALQRLLLPSQNIPEVAWGRRGAVWGDKEPDAKTNSKAVQKTKRSRFTDS